MDEWVVHVSKNKLGIKQHYDFVFFMLMIHCEAHLMVTSSRVVNFDAKNGFSDPIPFKKCILLYAGQ